MKTIINYFAIKRDKSIWIDPQGNQVCIKETSWFDGIVQIFNKIINIYYNLLILLLKSNKIWINY